MQRYFLKGDIFANAIARKNLSIKQAAMLLDITPEYLSLLIGEKESPGAALRERIQKFLPEIEFDNLFIRGI